MRNRYIVSEKIGPRKFLPLGFFTITSIKVIRRSELNPDKSSALREGRVEGDAFTWPFQLCFRKAVHAI